MCSLFENNKITIVKLFKKTMLAYHFLFFRFSNTSMSMIFKQSTLQFSMLMSLKIPPPSTIRKIRKLKKLIKKKLNGYKVFHDCSDREKKN